MRFLFTIVCLAFFYPVLSQSGPAKRALKALAESDLEKASEFIVKGLEKDSLDPLIYYDIARFQIQKPNPEPDSANHSEIRSRDLYSKLLPDDQEKYAKNGLTLISLDVLRSNIDSLAFARACAEPSEENFIYFLNHYPEAVQRTEAMLMRDSLAYVSALAENTYQSYRDFMDKYPESSQVALASERYERLFFEEATTDGKLASYEAFLSKNPATPYRAEVEWKIFTMSLAYPEPDQLRKFLQRFRSRPISGQIRNFLYYSIKEQGMLNAIPEIWNDSLRSIHQMNSDEWIATFDKDRAYFIDGSADQKFSIEREALSPLYRCEVLTTDYIVGVDQIYSRRGDIVYDNQFSSITTSRMGYLTVSSGNRHGLITSWGLTILPVEFEEIEVLESGMIKARKGGKLELYSFAGRQLTKDRLDDIQYAEGLYILVRNDQAAIVNHRAMIPALAGNAKLQLSYYDDYELLDGRKLWVMKGNDEGLLDFELKELIPLAQQRIEPVEMGFVVRKPSETIIFSSTLLQKYQTSESLLDFNDQYIRFSGPESEGLFDIAAFRFVALPDSAHLLGNYGALAYMREGYAIYQYGKEIMRSREKSVNTALLEHNRTEWVIIRERRNSQLVTNEGFIRLPDYDDISLLTDSLFIITRSGRKMLIDTKGKSQLPNTYEGMANFDGRDLSLLRNGKFGVYRPSEKMLIPASYEKILTAYGDYYFVAVKGGKKGLIDKSNEQVIPFIYDDIIYWNDTIIFGIDKNTYSFHEIGGDVLPEAVFTSYRVLRRDSTANIIMAFREDHFGVYSSTEGEVLPATFDDVIDLGNGGKPVYFTETYVEQADLHVVVYYDSDGRILKKQAMEPAFFTEVYCDD